MLEKILFFTLIIASACGTQMVPVIGSTASEQLSPPEPGETEILAEGVAAVTSSADIARDHAIDDALRKAVE